jgi:hypothetical protein
MHVSLLIADYADLLDGKLGVLGGGVRYTYRTREPPFLSWPSSTANTEQSGKKFDIALRIVTSGGEAVGEMRADGSAFRYEINDTLTVPAGPGVSRTASTSCGSDRFFGINLPVGTYRLEFLVDKNVAGRHVLEIREA